MAKVPYEIFEHTADIGLRVKGEDLISLFTNSGLALFEVSCRKQFVKDKTHTRIKVALMALSLEELFVNWLNELLSLSSAKGLIFHDIKVTKLLYNNLEAALTGNNINNYKVHTEIKAATYHNLNFKEVNGRWQVEVILDV